MANTGAVNVFVSVWGCLVVCDCKNVQVSNASLWIESSERDDTSATLYRTKSPFAKRALGLASSNSGSSSGNNNNDDDDDLEIVTLVPRFASVAPFARRHEHRTRYWVFAEERSALD